MGIKAEVDLESLKQLVKFSNSLLNGAKASFKRQGEWKKDGNGVFYCSCCNRSAQIQDRLTPFCPYCGNCLQEPPHWVKTGKGKWRCTMCEEDSEKKTPYCANCGQKLE